MSDLAVAYKWLDDQGAAFGAPGVEPRWTSSKKDTVATAYAASSRVWFTVSHGTLNEIYFPTIDRPQTRDMELLFSDGESFFVEEKRDICYEFSYMDANAPAVRVVGEAPRKKFKVTKEFISDPHHPVVMMHVKIEGDDAVLKKLKCYALLAPHLNGGGAGNNARSIEVAGSRAILCWKGNYSLAMGASCGFTRSSCGFVGESDGYQDLVDGYTMDWQFGQALEGNIAVMGEVEVSENREFTIALAFGEGHHAALSGMMQTLATEYAAHAKKFVAQWQRAGVPEGLGKFSGDKGKLARISQNVVLTHEDKTYSGAFIASASVPWGASKSDGDLGGYHLVWTRDMVQSATAMLACGRAETALRALVYLACTQRPDGSFAQNFWIDGTPYWTGIQLDEVAFPIMLAWRLWKQDALGDFDVFPFVSAAAAFLVHYAPVTQQERWEENAGYSPSTLAAVIAGLICAADLARANGAEDLGKFYEGYADWIEAHLDEWTTTDDGVLLDGVKRHYVRINPPACGEPFATDLCAEGKIRMANRGPGEKDVFEAREIVDGGFLELVRYGVRRADDPLILDTLKVVDAVLKRETPYGPCWRRYNHDGYGNKKDGGAFEGWGQGNAWPLLTGERGHYELEAGNDVTAYVKAMEAFASEGGMMPEQVWDYADLPDEGLYLGKSAGSAQPLVWCHAEYLKLLRSAADGRVFDKIAIVAERYAGKGKRKFKSEVEFFQIARPVSAVPAGKRLQIVDAKKFEVVWTADNWATQQRVESVTLGYAGWLAEIPTKAKQTGALKFTIFWPDEKRWLGKNFDVKVV